ncbi:PI-PLC X domain-containing protein 3-like [Tubulanus polymorphus]|uniref:PI-PLC X domain-containing protein 3-like n=1 Tax=Tubulanus polymorphus TaxID=672921 RepID=UPI003DA36657
MIGIFPFVCATILAVTVDGQVNVNICPNRGKRFFVKDVENAFNKVKDVFEGPVKSWFEEFFEIDIKNVKKSFTCQEYWMTNLPEHIRRRPLKNLVIPGSHNSFTIDHEVKSGNNFVPGEYGAAERWMKLVRPIVRDMSVTQDMNVMQQLQLGIRYFDIRTIFGKPRDNAPLDFYAAHGLYGGPSIQKLHHVKNFLDTHPREVVILFYQRFHEISPQRHEEHVSLINGVLGDKIVPCNIFDPNRSSLEDILAAGRQVLVIYMGRFCHPRLYLDNPFKSINKPGDLVKFMDQSLQTRTNQRLHVLQAVMQFKPDAIATCLKFKCASLKTYGKRSNALLAQWLNGKKNLNIVMVDYVEYAGIVNVIIAKNYE